MNKELDAAEATEQLYGLYKDDIYRYARYTLRNSAEAEDIVQEVFLKVLRKWDQFRGEAAPKTWLWTIARSCIIDRVRKLKRQPQEAQVQEDWDPQAPGQPYERIEMEQVLSGLRDNYREVIVLRILQDLPTADTAYILGWSESKVKSTLHRAIEKLRSEMSVDWERRMDDGAKLRRHSPTIVGAQSSDFAEES